MTAALEGIATAKGTTVAEMFALLGVGATSAGTGGSNVIRPPVFAKAAEALTLESIQERLEVGSDEGRLTPPEIAKADSLVARLGAVKKGTYDLEAWAREVGDSTPAVQALFAVTPVQAAA